MGKTATKFEEFLAMRRACVKTRVREAEEISRAEVGTHGETFFGTYRLQENARNVLL